MSSLYQITIKRFQAIMTTMKANYKANYNTKNTWQFANKNKCSTLNFNRGGDTFRERKGFDGSRKTVVDTSVDVSSVRQNGVVGCKGIKCERITFSRLDMLNLINNDEMPQDFLLPLSIVKDCVEINSIDLTFLINRNKTTVPSSEPVKENESNKVDLTWKFGSKLTKLVHYDNGYVPRKLRQEVNKDDILAFERNLKTVLNKMTPENFESCIGEIRKFNMKSEQNLISFVDQVFSKAIQEESYSKLYSKLACELSGLNANGKVFRSLLLNKCQQMFKKPLDIQIEEVKEFWNEKIKAEENERMKVMYEESIEEQVNKVKDKYFGNMRFISELYLQNEIPDKIIVHIVGNLLSKVTDCISLEAVCKMLVVVGKNLETKNPKQMDEFMVKIDQLSVMKELGMKMRFKFKDIIDMRKRNWQLRQIQILKNVEPKTLKELQQEEELSPPKPIRKQNRF